MARPLSPSAFLSALRAEGVRLCEDCVKSNWAGNSRGPFGAEVHAIVNHHTASNNTPTSLIRDGRPDLRGPLSIAHMTRNDGLIHLVGYGRCNHAGLCDGDVLRAAAAGTPAPRPNRDTTNFNPVTYSIEVNGTNDGRPFTPTMTDNLIRYNTAICRAHGWNANHVIGHSESTTRKPGDPSGIPMAGLRTAVTARLAAPAGPGGSITVKAGMTLGGIAAAAGVTLAALLSANPTITDPDRIELGQVIVLPGAPDAGQRWNAEVVGHPHFTMDLRAEQTAATADVQGHLNAWRHNRGLSQHNPAHAGRYDSWTQIAVGTFQEAYGLPRTGRVDDATWAKLHEITRGSSRS